MNCPVDGTTLVLAERNGIEIDHCPTCRGVWLDRGELDKIIDRAESFDTPGSPRNSRRDRDDKHDDDDRSYADGSNPSKRKRKSFLGDLFEMGG